MTTQQILDYYANLLIIQYLDQPRAFATIQTLVEPVIQDQLPTKVENAFELTTAEGVQLDVIGKYVGVTRTIQTPQGQLTLDDTDFLTLIQMAIIRNSSGSSLNTIQNLLHQYFPGEIFVFDHKDMRMSYLINTGVGSPTLLQFFIQEGLLPKPMGVQLSALIYTAPLKFFGMVSAKDVAAYAAQNSISIDDAANAIAALNNIYPFNTAAAPITGRWLSAQLGVPV